MSIAQTSNRLIDLINVLNSSLASVRDAIVLTSLVLVTGCASLAPKPVWVFLDPRSDNLTVQTPLPIKAGVYYSPEFKAFEYERYFMGTKVSVALGSASYWLFDGVLGASFREVISVDTIPDGLSPPSAGVDVFVEPRIEAFHHRLGLEGDSELASVTYQLRLYDPSGIPIGARFIRGKAADHKLSQTYTEWSNANLRNAAEKVPGALREMWSSYKSVQTAKAGSARIDPAQFEIRARPADDPFQVAPDKLLRLAGTGIVAISVSVMNNGTNPVLIRDQDFALVLPTGHRLTPPSSLAVLQSLDHGGIPTSTGYALFDVAFSGVQSEQRAGAINLLHEKGFRDLKLNAGESGQATVFFIPPAGVPAFSTADLLVWLVDPGNYGTTFAKVRIASLRSIEDKPRDQEQIPTATSPAAPQPRAAMSPTPTPAPAKPVASAIEDKPRDQEQIPTATSPAAPQPRAAMSPTPTPAPAKPVAIGVGGLRQGDRWEYTFVDSRNGRPASRRFEIEQIDGESIVERIELEDGRTLAAAHRGGAYLNMLGGMQFAPYYFAFQPEAATSPVGKLRVEGGDACGGARMTLYNTYECEVSAVFDGSESVTVPVGTFEAQRVRVKVYQQVWGSTAAGNLSGVIAYGQFWISLKAGRIVKAVIKYEADRPWTETMELVSYPTGDRMTGSRTTAHGRELPIGTGF